MDLAFSKTSFRDVDQFSEWEIDLGWEIESTQLSRGANLIGFDHCVFPDLVVGHFHGRRSMHNEFELPKGTVIVFVTRAPIPVVWCGRELPPTHLSVVRPGRTHWVALPDGWDCYEFMVAEDLIRRTELIPPGYFERARRIEEAVLPLAQPQAGVFLGGMDRWFRRMRAAREAAGEWPCAAEFYEFILGGLQRLADAGLAAEGRPEPRPTRRADLVLEARRFMKTHLTRNLTADEIAQALGVSYRVLNYAFRDAFGIGPYRYFLTERLHASRRLLVSGQASVTEACIVHGFGTPSRFARQYMRLFGKLPSADKATS